MAAWRKLSCKLTRHPCARGSRDAVSTHGGGVRVWCSRFDRTRSNGNFVHLLPERLATSRIWSRCHEGFPSLQATGQKRVRLPVRVLIHCSEFCVIRNCLQLAHFSNPGHVHLIDTV